MSEVEKALMDHGVIENITIPAGFKTVEPSEDEKLNNYFEYEAEAEGCSVRICYEETSSPLSEEDREALRKLFDEKHTDNEPARKLNLGYKKDGNAISTEDMSAYMALCQCFVFGGRLVRGGSCLDEQKSSWETRRVGDGDKARTVIVGNLRFQSYDGKPDKKRQVCMVMPVMPSDGGNGYIWLEGDEKELTEHSGDFLDKIVGQGKFRELVAAIS